MNFFFKKLNTRRKIADCLTTASINGIHGWVPEIQMDGFSNKETARSATCGIILEQDITQC